MQKLIVSTSKHSFKRPTDTAAERISSSVMFMLVLLPELVKQNQIQRGYNYQTAYCQ
jgi:hypothetical protein